VRGDPCIDCNRLGAAIARRAQELVKAKMGGASNGQVTAASDPVPVLAERPAPAPHADDPAPAQAEAPGVPEVLKPYLVTLHGKQFVRYVGLLLLAHQRGLQSLKTHFLSVTAELAMAEAEATFADGRVFSEAADATPTNVGLQVKAHYPRMALTRAKARTLCAVKAA
jgi:hypothetical protein